MRTLVLLGCAACFVLPVAASAQNCDVLVQTASWSTHPDPDSIYVNFRPDITSAQPQNPREYDVMVNMRYNSVLIDQHQLHLRWAHGVGCPVDCPHVICEEKEWSFKGVVFRDNSKCIRGAQQQCVCPSLGDPVAHRKPMPKPQTPQIIEVELVPLNLQGCNPINPGNDRVQFAYPGTGPTPITPAAPPVVVLSLLMGLAGVVLLSLRLRRRAA